ncbi:hypothetical protein BJY16_003704 [Actinoplanes octamycinicus]|uniref:NERD domain-containing protein n=1 Tax=Actinoplanes octamycinicus TaxID=135948 RepID=A0A7W7GXP6_9ACTN|nr:hypothetical protein [Actinoplanes octamycinicus]GIE63457.1 hypothetical protein Aoc01nite_88590 [Actinoplanes octamycinicus]
MPRVTPVEWARRVRAERDHRRLESADARVLARLDRLGPDWFLVDLPVGPGFLAIGPGGTYAVTVADHGRSRVLIVGDTVQIGGRRPPYVIDARLTARRTAEALSADLGRAVPVTPVLTFIGSGVISFHGLPRECLIATDRELDRLLLAGGARLSKATVKKLAEIAEEQSRPAGR